MLTNNLKNVQARCLLCSYIPTSPEDSIKHHVSHLGFDRLAALSVYNAFTLHGGLPEAQIL